MTQEYTIQVKGNIPRMITESKIYKREYTDFSYGYGFIKFKGTETQLDKLLNELAEQGDNDFKVIGVHDDETEKFYQEMFPEAYEKFKQSHKL
tara:strand:- start:73 stop:351 length:279 start_codon:yes stop_codon:yes gene_type:complete